MRLLITTLVTAVTVAGVLVAQAATASASAASTHPRVGAVSPTAGPTKGGNRLTIRGRHLGRVTAVTIGGKRATKLKHVSSQRLEVVVPKHAKGKTRVHLLSRYGRSGTSVRYTYTTLAKPVTSRPVSIDPVQGELAGLSCPAAGFCAAVDGRTPDHRLVVIRSGQPTVTTSAKSVLAVSCASPSYCVALAEHAVSVWNGTTWGAFHEVGPNDSHFDRISCPVGTQVCVATGQRNSIILHGLAWQAVPRPTDSALGELSCASVTFCVSIGYEASYVFHGAKWADAPKPTGLEGPFGATVSCVSSTFCLAMDGVGDVARFDGTAWHKIAALGHSRSYLEVSCASSTECLVLAGSEYAVEYKDGSFGAEQRVGDAGGFSSESCVPDGVCVVANLRGQTRQHSASGWTAPAAVTPSTGDLTDISCVSSTWCMAVDAKGNAVRGAGTAWAEPQRIDGFRALVALACRRGGVCVALDGDGYAVTYQHGAWAAPQRIDATSVPTDVDCPSVTKCLAVDANGRVLTWNGAHWSAPKKISHRLYGISCPTAKLCVAAGEHSMLLEHGRWTTIAAPVNSGFLNAVTCLRATYCVAAGDGGFFIWQHRTWSRAIGHVPNGMGITIGCSSDLACRGFVDDSESYYSVRFAGAATSVYGAGNAPPISCVPNSVCATVSADRVSTFR